MIKKSQEKTILIGSVAKCFFRDPWVKGHWLGGLALLDSPFRIQMLHVFYLSFRIVLNFAGFLAKSLSANSSKQNYRFS